MGQDSESRRTVLVALAANLVIAGAKAFAGLLSGSAALLAEAAHSVADTLNEVFLLAALQRSRRPADADHPFGYGKERFFWALLAAVGIFVAGAGFSAYEGISALVGSSSEGGFAIAYAVLAVAFVVEGVSWLRAIRQLRAESRAAGRGPLEQLRTAPDPTVRTVATEDSAALVGIVLAALGLGLRQATGSGVWDGVASLLIAALLIFVAYALGRDNKELLIGEAAPAELRQAIGETVQQHEGVDRVLETLTMRLGPDRLLVAMRLDVADDLDGGRLEQISTDIERELAERFPEVVEVFLDPTDHKAPRGVRP